MAGIAPRARVPETAFGRPQSGTRTTRSQNVYSHTLLTAALARNVHMRAESERQGKRKRDLEMGTVPGHYRGELSRVGSTTVTSGGS